MSFVKFDGVPHLFPIGVKYDVRNLQVMLSNVSNFRENRLGEIDTSLTGVYIITSAHAL